MLDPTTMHSQLGTPLQRALQWVVIPDLIRRRARTAPQPKSQDTIAEQDSVVLARASLESSAALMQELERLLAAGWTMDRLYLEGIVGAARQLGRWWEADLLDFASVTIASVRLQTIVRTWDDRFRASAPPIPGADRFTALLVGEFNGQHNLGLLMLQAMFRRDGWKVQDSLGMNEDSLLAHVASNSIDLIGLSLATQQAMPRAKQLIQEVRQRSLNPDILVIVGGPLLLAQPDLSLDLKADWACKEADHASRGAFQRVFQRASKGRV